MAPARTPYDPQLHKMLGVGETFAINPRFAQYSFLQEDVLGQDRRRAIIDYADFKQVPVLALDFFQQPPLDKHLFVACAEHAAQFEKPIDYGQNILTLVHPFYTQLSWNDKLPSEQAIARSRASLETLVGTLKSRREGLYVIVAEDDPTHYPFGTSYLMESNVIDRTVFTHFDCGFAADQRVIAAIPDAATWYVAGGYTRRCLNDFALEWRETHPGSTPVFLKELCLDRHDLRPGLAWLAREHEGLIVSAQQISGYIQEKSDDSLPRKILAQKRRSPNAWPTHTPPLNKLIQTQQS